MYKTDILIFKPGEITDLVLSMRNVFIGALLFVIRTFRPQLQHEPCKGSYGVLGKYFNGHICRGN